MPLTLRSALGSPLSIAQMDGNFTYLEGLVSGIVGDSYASWSTTAGTASLPINKQVLVLDAYGTYGTYGTHGGAILTTNLTGDGFLPYGIGLFLNADFQAIGNYGSLVGYTGHQGVWNALSEPGYSNGNVVIWNCLHYFIISASSTNGSSPDSNSSAYSVLSSSTANGYVLEYDEIVFDFPNNTIDWRSDKRGNIINNSSFSNFQFGDNGIHDLHVENEDASISTLNNTGEITGRLSGDSVYAYTQQNSGFIYLDLAGSWTYTYLPSNSGHCELHCLGYSAGMEAENNSGEIIVYLNDLSYFEADNNAGEIYASYNSGCDISHVNNNGDILFVNFSAFNGAIVLGEASIEYSVFENTKQYFTYVANNAYESGASLTSSESTFACTIDITGLTTLDITFANAQCGIVYVTSSNGSESINQILNCPYYGFPVTIIPINELTLTINPTSAGSYGSGVILADTLTPIVLSARGNITTSDNIIVTYDNSGNYGALIKETNILS